MLLEFKIDEIPKVESLANNQYIIDYMGFTILQSYNKTVAIQFKNQIYLDRYYWNYSKTTSKYVSRFLRMGIKEIKEKINSGEFKLEKFNY